MKTNTQTKSEANVRRVEFEDELVQMMGRPDKI